MCNMNETRRYRRIVGSLAGSCLLAAIPLLSSLSEPACLVSLDIVEVLNYGHNLILFLTKSRIRSCLLGAIIYFYFGIHINLMILVPKLHGLGKFLVLRSLGRESYLKTEEIFVFGFMV